MADAMNFVDYKSSYSIFLIELVQDAYETLGLNHFLRCQVDDLHSRIIPGDQRFVELFFNFS
jgi:hypothetical protein